MADQTLNLMMPGNARYQPSSLQEFFGYDYLARWITHVEIATLQVLGDVGSLSPEAMAALTPEVCDQALAITTTQMDKKEREVTKHDIRALVLLGQDVLRTAHPDLARMLHVPNTSYDPLDTSRILQFRAVYEKVARPSLEQVMRLFVELVRKFANQVQIGRTHGQHALPITVGFWMATILHRILYNVRVLDACAGQLVGKISGAVGAHNAQIGLGFQARCGAKSFEERVLEKLGLCSAPISTQILQPEPLAYFFFSCFMLSAALGQFGRDCRQLMRTEIGEVREEFDAHQTGSSTMAHKRNPINFENLEGTFLKSKKEMVGFMDLLVSEHQRDLVGSAPARDLPLIVINLQLQLETLLRKNASGAPFLQRISVDPEACKRNLALSQNVILSEPMYIALAMAEHPDAHSFVNHVLVPKAQESNQLLVHVLQQEARQDSALDEVVQRIPQEVISLLSQPNTYYGDAPQQAHKIADMAEAWLQR